MKAIIEFRKKHEAWARDRRWVSALEDGDEEVLAEMEADGYEGDRDRLTDQWHASDDDAVDLLDTAAKVITEIFSRDIIFGDSWSRITEALYEVTGMFTCSEADDIAAMMAVFVDVDSAASWLAMHGECDCDESDIHGRWDDDNDKWVAWTVEECKAHIIEDVPEEWL